MMRFIENLGWTDTDAMRARNEGWRLGYIAGRPMCQASIVRHSSVPSNVSRFISREEAEKFVLQKAEAGEPLHAKAVAIMMKSRLL